MIPGALHLTQAWFIRVSDEASNLHSEQSFLGEAKALGTTKTDDPCNDPCTSEGIYRFTPGLPRSFCRVKDTASHGHTQSRGHL